MLIYSYINTSGNWKNEKLCGNTTPEKWSVFTQFRVFPISTSVDITVYQHGKMFYNFFIAMSKARRIRKISVFTSGGKFSVFTLSHVNTALNQSAFRIHKCYIIMSISWQHYSRFGFRPVYTGDFNCNFLLLDNVKEWITQTCCYEI